jgi:hypothetical protein
MKVLPALSPGHVGDLAKPAVFGWQRRLRVLDPARYSSEASACGRTPSGRGLGIELITMSEPLSVTQILSVGSTFTVWPNDQA